MKTKIVLFIAFFFTAQILLGQPLTLKKSIESAKQNSTVIDIAEQSLETRRKLNEATKLNYLPKADILAGYNHLGEKARLNLQAEKENVINYSSEQINSTASQIYQQLTGSQLPSNIQNLINQTSQNLLNTIYPTGNPQIGKKDYLLAGIIVRQPIYLGGKLKAARDLAGQQLESGQINLENAQQLIAYQTALQYIRIMYLNAMITKQQEMVVAQRKNSEYAAGLVRAEILPPYQKNWADVAEKQAETGLENFRLEKENALLTLKSLMGMNADDSVTVETVLADDLPDAASTISTTNNTDLRLLHSKKIEAEKLEKITGTIGKPNIFAIGNVQFFRKDLPIILPPWMVGIEMQWTIFDREKKSRNLAARSLVDESTLLIRQKQETTDLALSTTRNTLTSLKRQSETLRTARDQTYTTTAMVRKRLENSLSSVKDVNDALQLQIESEKLYYSSLVAYQVALATYYYLQGQPEAITQFIP